MAESNVIMYDAVSPEQLPADTEWVAGYADGRFANLTAIRRRFPKAHVVSIAVSSQTDALALDIEHGDASQSQAPGWIRRQIARGVHGPILYTSLSGAQELLNTMSRAGVHRDLFRLWTAHYTHEPHICDEACGLGFRGRAGATQWTDGAGYDTSLVAPRFWRHLVT